MLSCALLLCACKTRPEYVFNNVDRCEYTLTESGDHVANINKEKYLSSAVAPPADAVDIRDHVTPRQGNTRALTNFSA